MTSKFVGRACIFGALTVSALSLGLVVSTVQADEPLSDTYQTGLPHITIRAIKDAANPLEYPDRFEALQVFKGNVPDGTDGSTLTSIVWGASINPEGLISQMVNSSWGIGRLNSSSSTSVADDYAGINTFGDLFTRWCSLNIRDVISAYNNAGAGPAGLAAAKATISSSNVSALSVANFLQQFALGDDDTTSYSSPSIFTSSEVAAGFAYAVSQTSSVNAPLEEGISKWTSYALNSDITGMGTNIARNLIRSTPEGDDSPPTSGWVIDNVVDFGDGFVASPSATSVGLEKGYYVVLDRLSDDVPVEDSEDNTGMVDAGVDYESHKHSAISELILRVVGDEGLFVNLKNDIPTVDKKIKGVDTDDAHDANVVATSDRVQYILTATLPDNVSSYHSKDDPNKNEYMIKFHDTLPDLLSLDYDSLHVFVNVEGTEGACSDVEDKTNSDLNNYRDTLGQEGNNAIEVDLHGFDYVSDSEAPGLIQIDTNSWMFHEYPSCDLHIAIPNVFNLKPKDGTIPIPVTKDSIIYATYDGIIGENIYSGYEFEYVVGSLKPKKELKNTVYLEYSNNPYSDGTGCTPPDSVQHYTFGIDLQKFENDFGDDNEVLKGAGFSIINSSGSDGVLSKPEFNLDTDDLRGKEDNIKVAWFKEYVHRSGRGGDPTAIYKPGQSVYVFAGWHKPVLADASYVEWYKANGANPTGHMHEGMLVAGLDRNGSPVMSDYTYSIEYHQVLFTDEFGQVPLTGLGTGSYTVIESLTPVAHEPLQPFAWTFQTTNTNENATDFTVLNDAGQPVTTADAEYYTEGDARIGQNSRHFDENVWNETYPSFDYEATTSPYEGNATVSLQLRNLVNFGLPTTGGIGTTLLYASGVVLVIGTIAYTAYRHRQNSYED